MALTGKSGSVYVGANKVAEISNWSLDIGADEIDITNFDSDGWKEFLAGLKEWSGNAEGNWKMSDTNGQKALQDALLGGTTVALELRLDANNKYAGDAFITGISIESPNDDKIPVTFDFRGTGALTPTIV